MINMHSYTTKLHLQIRNSGEELKLPKERTKSLHELLTRMIVNTFVGCYDNFWIFCQPLHLFLHVACMVRASVIAPAIYYVANTNE